MWEQNTFMFFSGTEEQTQEKISAWENLYPTRASRHVYHCFEAYFDWSIDSSFDKDFFFSFPALPVWYKRVIKKLNRYFKNISYEIINEKEVFINSSFPDIQGLELGGYLQKAICPLIKLNLNENYSRTSKYYLRYLLHHVIRVMSYPEMFIKLNEVEHDKKYDSIQWLCDLNNRNPGYRSITEGTLFKDMFKYLDDIDLVNKTEWRGWGPYHKIRQTGIFSNILTTAGWKFTSKFNIGDLIKPNDGANQYAITNKEMLQAEIIQTYSFGNISIRILKHKNRGVYGYTSRVDENNFDLYTEAE